MMSLCKISFMKLTCLVLIIVTVCLIAWHISHILTDGNYQLIGLSVPHGHWDVRPSDVKQTSPLGLMKRYEFGHHKQDSDYALWKIRLKEKWERHKKKLQRSRDMDDMDNYANGSFVKYVDLPLEPSWDLDSLWDYFTDTPSCRHPTFNDNQWPFLLILVTSAPADFDRRASIRKASARQADFQTSHLVRNADFQTIFLIGKAPTEVLEILVEAEVGHHGDILRGNYRDSYRNLTLKVLHGLIYASKICKPKYVLKTDDDCFVNVPLILDFLQHHNRQRQALYVGKVLSQNRTKVVRNPGNKWHVPSHLYAPEFYPPYPSGHGYIISGDLLDTLLNASTRLKPFPNEDAYIGVLMNAIGVRPINTFRFTLYNFRWRICNLLYLMVIHHISPEEQGSLVDMALMAKQQCPGQAEVTEW